MNDARHPAQGLEFEDLYGGDLLSWEQRLVSFAAKEIVEILKATPTNIPLPKTKALLNSKEEVKLEDILIPLLETY